jgi:hypothetical protein
VYIDRSSFNVFYANFTLHFSSLKFKLIIIIIIIIIIIRRVAVAV